MQRDKQGKAKMCVIGFGRMGKRATQIFSAGFEVAVVTSQTVAAEIEAAGAVPAESPETALRAADYVFLAVPVDVVASCADRINELSPRGCVVIDCCSARVAAEQELSRVQRKRFGLPELGSSPTSVVGEPDRRIASFLKERGCLLKPVTPEECDRANAVVGMAHFLGMALDLSLTATERLVMGESGAGSLLLDIIEHLKTNSPTTYRETQTQNPYTSAARKRLIRALIEADRDLDDGIYRFSVYERDRWRA